MIKHVEISDEALRLKIRNGMICVAGNQKLKIYGGLHCASGKRMNRSTRVFFHSAGDALKHGYRPCGNCMRSEYIKWKNGCV